MTIYHTFLSYLDALSVAVDNNNACITVSRWTDKGTEIRVRGVYLILQHSVKVPRVKKKSKVLIYVLWAVTICTSGWRMHWTKYVTYPVRFTDTKSGVYKSRVPGRRGGWIFYDSAWYSWIISMELPSHKPFSGQNIEVALRAPLL